jgi:hypothetical protein
MSGVFQNIDPLLVRGENTLAGWKKGGGVNNFFFFLYNIQHCYCSVLYICKYFVLQSMRRIDWKDKVQDECMYYIKFHIFAC